MCLLRLDVEDRGKSSESQWYVCFGIQDKSMDLAWVTGAQLRQGRGSVQLEKGRDSMRYLGFTTTVKGKIGLITLGSPLSICLYY